MPLLEQHRMLLMITYH